MVQHAFRDALLTWCIGYYRKETGAFDYRDYSPVFRRFSTPEHVSRGIALQIMVTSEDGVEAVWRLEVRIRETYL